MAESPNAPRLAFHDMPCVTGDEPLGEDSEDEAMDLAQVGRGDDGPLNGL